MIKAKPVPFRRKGQKVYYFYFYSNHKRISKSTGETLKWAAELFIEEFMKKTTSPDVQFSDYARDFFKWGSPWILRQHAAGYHFSRAVADMRQSHLDNYLLDKFGDRALRTLNNPNEVFDWLLSLPLSNQTRNHFLSTLSLILSTAEEERLIDYLPRFRRFAKTSRETDIYTLEELRLLFPDRLDLAQEIWGHPKYAAAFGVLASTGVRSGECRALEWRHYIDQSALIVEQAVKPKGEIGVTKGGYPRGVLLPSRPGRLLDYWQHESPYTQPDDLIFFGEKRNKPLNRRTLNDALARAIKSAGIEAGGRRLTVHGLRHTYNTLMKTILPADVLREMVGHKSEVMTMSYDHPSDEMLLKRIEGARELVDTAWN